MKKNIDLIIDGIAPEKVMYDTDNHSLVVFYPAQEEFKVGDKVRLKKDLDLKVGDKSKGNDFVQRMYDIRDATLTVEEIGSSNNLDEPCDYVQCRNNLDSDWWRYSPEWLEHVTEDAVEFKRGDIVFEDGRIIIVKNMPSNYYVRYYQPRNNISFNSLYGIPFSASTVRLATPEEQQTLFDALKKEGLKWNAEKLEIEKLDISEIVVDLKTACEYLNKKGPNFSIQFCSLSVEDYNKYYAQITLQLIREAWNKFDGFEANWNWNDNEQNIKYCPIIDDDEIAFSCHNVVKTIESTCYSFPTKERALQFCSQFKELFETAMGL